MFEFYNSQFLWGLLFAVAMIFFIKKRKNDIAKIFAKDIFEKIKIKNGSISHRTRSFLLIGAFAFMVLALSRPIINNGKIEVKSSFVNMVVGIDISRSMFANDLYPNRFEFAKKKFITMLSYLKKSKVALIGFSSQSFLISPLTQDFYSLKFLANNWSNENVTLKGTDILNALKTANELMKNQKRKIVLLFTDGGDKKDFTKEIAYAKEHHIVVYIYGVGTKKGGVLKGANGMLKDKRGDIVVVKLNENIKQLALKTGGAYMKQSLNKDDVKILSQDIENHFKATSQEEETVVDKKELFYAPLAIALLLLFMALFSLPNMRGKR